MSRPVRPFLVWTYFRLIRGESRPILYRTMVARYWIDFILDPAEGLRVELKINGETPRGCRPGSVDAMLFASIAPRTKGIGELAPNDLAEAVVYYPLDAGTEPREMRLALKFVEITTPTRNTP